MRNFFVQRIVSNCVFFYFISVIAFFVILFVCESIKPKTCLAAKGTVKIVPVPKNVFTLFGEVMAIKAEGTAGELLKRTKIDLSPMMKQHPDLKEVFLLLYEDGRIKRKLEYESKGHRIFADINAGQTYLIFKVPTGRIRDNYDVLYIINRLKGHVNPDRIELMCRYILCSPDTHSASELFTEFPELKNFINDENVKNILEERMLDDLQIGGLGTYGLSGNICDRCAGFNKLDLIFPNQDWKNPPPMPFPVWIPHCWNQQGRGFSAVDYWSQRVEPFLREIEPCVHHIHPDTNEKPDKYVISLWRADLLDKGDTVNQADRVVDPFGGNTGGVRGNGGKIETKSGNVGNAFDFIGSNRIVVDQNNAPELDLEMENFTLTAWIKPNTISGTQTVIFKGTRTVNFGYNFSIQNDGKLFCSLEDTNTTGSAGNEIKVSSNSAIDANNFTHIAAVCNRSQNTVTLSLFINGVPNGSNTGNCFGSLFKEGHFSIGGPDTTVSNTSGWAFKGLIDEVVVFKGALSAAEINDLYQRNVSTIYNQGRKHFINVKDFGAVGDGLADDTEAIKNVLERAQKTKEVVFFPRGTYLTSLPLQIQMPLHIIGDNAVIKAARFMDTVINISVVSVQLEGFTLDANHIADYGLKAVSMLGRKNAIEHVTVLNAIKDGIYLDQCQTAVLKYVSSLNNGGGGFYLTSCNGLCLVQTEATNNGGSGYVIDTKYVINPQRINNGIEEQRKGSGHLWLNGFSAVGNAGHGIYVKPSHPCYLVEGPVIRNGWIKDNALDGIRIESVGSVVTNTIFSNTIHSDEKDNRAIRLNKETMDICERTGGHRIFNNKIYSPISEKYALIENRLTLQCDSNMPNCGTTSAYCFRLAKTGPDAGTSTNIIKDNTVLEKPLAPPPPLPIMKIVECGDAINVWDWDSCAVGDGQTDDTAAIQSAINEALKMGKEVYIPRGDYLITSPLIVNGLNTATSQSSIGIHGEGATIRAGNHMEKILDLENVNITLLGLVLDGNKMADKGIAASHIKPHSHFQHLAIVDTLGDSISIKNSTNTVIEHVSVASVARMEQPMLPEFHPTTGFYSENNNNLTLNLTMDQSPGTGTGYLITGTGTGVNITAFVADGKSKYGVQVKQPETTLMDGWLEGNALVPLLIESQDVSVSGLRIITGGDNFPISLVDQVINNNIYANQFGGGAPDKRKVDYQPGPKNYVELNVKSYRSYYLKADKAE